MVPVGDVTVMPTGWLSHVWQLVGDQKGARAVGVY
jgi:hypothetical protein